MKKAAVPSILIAVVLVAVEGIAEAQPQAKVSKIGWLGGRPDDSTTSVASLRRELRALGYVEGKNITFEYRNAGNKIERLLALADELVRLRVAVLFALPAPAAVAAKTATRTIPVVFVAGFDPRVEGTRERR
jgi:putative ABC transport system substrate-binding protein